MSADTLTLRQLNRATLARQMLLQRVDVAPREAIQTLAGMQAQEARPPFIGLWSRITGLQREDLHRAYHARDVVRATLMRGTLHAFAAADYAAFRATLQPMLTRAIGVVGNRAAGLDLDRLVPVARAILAEGPLTFNELRPDLAARFPEADERVLGLATRMSLPLVMIPSDDRWAFPADSRFGLAEQWLDLPLIQDEHLQRLIPRYLAAFGPASVADAQTWSGLRGLQDTFEALRPRLRGFRDERGREVFDLPEAPRPDESVPVPPRFLPEFDNLLLSHVDRRRVLADEYRDRVKIAGNLRVRATFLIDGFVAGTWRVERTRKTAILFLSPFAALPRDALDALRDEGEALVRFIDDAAETRQVILDPPA